MTSPTQPAPRARDRQPEALTQPPAVPAGTVTAPAVPAASGTPEDVKERLVVEEISIDGMCGVY